MARHRHAARIAERSNQSSNNNSKKRARSASPEPARVKRAKKERSPSPPSRKLRGSKYITEEEADKPKAKKKESLAKPMKKKQKTAPAKGRIKKASHSREDESEEEEEEERPSSDESDQESENESEGEGYIRESSRRSSKSNQQKKKKKKKTGAKSKRASTDEESDHDEEETRLMKREAQRSRFKRPMSVVMPEKDGAVAASSAESAKRLSTAEKAALRRIHDRSFARKLSGQSHSKVDDLHLKISSAKAMHKMLLTDICPEACRMVEVVDPNDEENEAGEKRKIEVNRVQIHMGDQGVQCLAMAAAQQLINHVLPAALSTTLSGVSMKKVKPEDIKSEDHLQQLRQEAIDKARLNRKIEPRAMDAAFRAQYVNNPILLRRYNELCVELDQLHDEEMARERVRSQADREYLETVKRLKALDAEEQKLAKVGGLSVKDREEQLKLKHMKRSYEKKKAQASLERAQHAIETAEKTAAAINEKIPELKESIREIDETKMPKAIKAEKKAEASFEKRRLACKAKEDELKEMRERLRASSNLVDEEGAREAVKEAASELDAMRKDKKAYEASLNAARSKVRVLSNTKARALKSIENQKHDLEACKVRVLRNKDIVEEKKALVKQRTQQLAALNREKKDNK